MSQEEKSLHHEPIVYVLCAKCLLCPLGGISLAFAPTFISGGYEVCLSFLSLKYFTGKPTQEIYCVFWSKEKMMPGYNRQFNF